MEVQRRLAERGTPVGIGTVHRFFRRHGLTRKKRPATPIEQDRPDILTQRRAWFEAQPDLDPARLVFIDETWASTAMARSHGRAPRGERLRMGLPFGHWKTTTFVAGLRLSGIVAPMVLDGPINRRCFEAYTAQILVPELRLGDVVIMDNLSSHKSPATPRRHRGRRGGKLRFLPPYSPDFNPIEMAFAKLKAGLRKAAERTVDGLWSRHRSPDRPLHPDRMRQLLQRRWLCARVSGERSSTTVALEGVAFGEQRPRRLCGRSAIETRPRPRRRRWFAPGA